MTTPSTEHLLAEQFGANITYFNQWREQFQITQDDINFALAKFDQKQRFRLICRGLKPMEYLLQYPELLKIVYEIDVEYIRKLPFEVFKQHLAQLERSDKIYNKTRNRAFPHDNFDAQAFYGLRNAHHKKDITFIKFFHSRSISHASYRPARMKLLKMISPMHQQMVVA